MSSLEPLDEGAGTESASTSSSADAASLAGLASTLSRSSTQVCRTDFQNSSNLAPISATQPINSFSVAVLSIFSLYCLSNYISLLS